MSTLKLGYADRILTINVEGSIEVRTDTYLPEGSDQEKTFDGLFCDSCYLGRKRYPPGSMPRNLKRAFEYMHKHEQLEYIKLDGETLWDVDVDAG